MCLIPFEINRRDPYGMLTKHNCRQPMPQRFMDNHAQQIRDNRNRGDCEDIYMCSGALRDCFPGGWRSYFHIFCLLLLTNTDSGSLSRKLEQWNVVYYQPALHYQRSKRERVWLYDALLDAASFFSAAIICSRILFAFL